jgi:hypothetical protein
VSDRLARPHNRRTSFLKRCQGLYEEIRTIAVEEAEPERVVKLIEDYESRQRKHPPASDLPVLLTACGADF